MKHLMGLRGGTTACLLLLLTTIATKVSVADAATITWQDAPSPWDIYCEKVTGVFGVTVCAPSTTFSDRTKVDHVVNVLFQLLDNDADGNADDPTVLAYMVSNKYAMLIPADEDEFEEIGNLAECFDEDITKLQTVFIDRIVTNSCEVPTNRGASATDRTTWSAVRDTSSSTTCSNEIDATTEEVLHLINEAAAALYPSKWGTTFSSTAGAAISAANGNCGWGFQGNWIDPSTTGCSGQFAYSDETCEEDCIVIEGVYWASVTYIGGLYTVNRAQDIQGEWLMTTPDDGMVVEPSAVTNAMTLQSGSPALYALVSDTTSTENAWLPLIMPDGNYQGSATATNVACGTAPAPCPSFVSYMESWWIDAVHSIQTTILDRSGLL